MIDELVQFKQWFIENLPETRGVQVASILSLLQEYSQGCDSLADLDRRLRQASKDPRHVEDEPLFYLLVKIREYQKERWVIE